MRTICRTIPLSLATVVVFAVLAGEADANIVTFGDGPGIFANGYTEAGMTISTSNNSYRYIVDWQSFPGGDPTQTSGERELLENDGDTYLFSLVSGGTFDLSSLDIEDPFGTGSHWSSSGTIDVIGSNAAVVTLSGEAFGTHSFGSTFDGISSFTIQYATSSQVTFDNINFETVVPEPISLAIWSLLGGLGLAVGWLRRRRA